MAGPGAAGLTGGLGDLGKLAELRQRILFVLGAILVFRIGSFIPLPGIDPIVLETLVEQQEGTILDMFNMFSGGALERLSLFALGIMPYISASIIMQLLSYTVPTLEQLKKEGEAGRRKITQYTRYATVVLASFQAIGISPFRASCMSKQAGRSMNTTWFSVTLKSWTIVGPPTVIGSVCTSSPSAETR